MVNLPEVKLGIVAVSRNCFPIELSRSRRNLVFGECGKKGIDIVNCETIVETEKDVLKALDELTKKKINALVIYLGNFGPEGPISMLAQRFSGPVMIAAAAEENSTTLMEGRGDAYCGMLSMSYNLGLRGLKPHIPEYPVGLPAEVAEMIKNFLPVARVVLGLKSVKIFSFGPRPQDFLACNAPIKPLYELGVEIMENSELDMYDIFREAENAKEIGAIAKEMEKELGKGNTYPDILKKLAQFEYALTKFCEDNLGAAQFGVFANKCWPSFEKYFGFVPCYVNSRLSAKGFPVSCEVDIYGVLSEYMLAAAGLFPSTLLDINNTVPYDMFDKSKAESRGYKPNDLFMGFHCGNTASSCLVDYSMKYQYIMHKLIEPGKEPDITRGTLEGRLMPGEATIFRLQSTDDCRLNSYIAQGEVIDVDHRSFGGTGVIAIKEMGRFFRYVLIQKRFPHHSAVAFRHLGKTMFNSLKMLGVDEIYHPLPSDIYYPDENPFVHKTEI